MFSARRQRTAPNAGIKGIARVKFLPGKVEEWKRLTEQAMEIVRTKE
jgi:hypothetical protein